MEGAKSRIERVIWHDDRSSYEEWRMCGSEGFLQPFLSLLTIKIIQDGVVQQILLRNVLILMNLKRGALECQTEGRVFLTVENLRQMKFFLT